METKNLTNEERIANLPEVYRDFAMKVSSEKVLKTLEMSARMDALNKAGKDYRNDSVFAKFGIGTLTINEALLFAMEYNLNEKFRTFGASVIKNFILKKFKLAASYFLNM